MAVGGTRPARGADGGRHRERGGGEAALRAEHRHGGDGLVLVARARRSHRRQEARDRRALLQHVRLQREGPAPGQGHGEQGAGLRARRGRRPRPRRREGDRRRRQRRDRGGLQPRRRRAAAQGRLARLDLQRRPVPGDPRHGGGRPRRRRSHRGRGHDHQHVVHRLAGLRLHRLRRQRARLAAVQRGRRDLQRRRQPRLRGLRGERRDRAARRRPATRGRRHLRQPPDQPLQPRRHVGARVAVVHEPPERPRREAASAGASSSAGSSPRSRTTTTTGTPATGPT